MLATVLAALVVFHSPDGAVVGVDVEQGQVIVRPAPPGFKGTTLIETGAGKIIVQESVCEVLRALERKCKKDAP